MQLPKSNDHFRLHRYHSDCEEQGCEEVLNNSESGRVMRRRRPRLAVCWRCLHEQFWREAMVTALFTFMFHDSAWLDREVFMAVLNEEKLP